MIFFDTTRTGSTSHRSGLTRVSSRLLASLGDAATPVTWRSDTRALSFPTHRQPRADDWFLTSELFSEEERPGLSDFLDARPLRLAAIFHDAIPLKHPHITWPRSVARHPGYMKLLARFDRVWAVSQASRDELIGFWRWQGIEPSPSVDVLPLGADFAPTPRITSRLPPPPVPRFLCVGIIEPRKNQNLLLDACEALWAEGLRFGLDVVGRVNPHFGRPIAARLRRLQRTHPDSLRFHEAADDATLTRLYASARATIFASIAEGCGLPLLESLWQGVPCLCADIPALLENASGGGCLAVPSGDLTAWCEALRRILTDDPLLTRLAAEATARPLPTWAATATTLREGLVTPPSPTSSSPA